MTSPISHASKTNRSGVHYGSPSITVLSTGKRCGYQPSFDTAVQYFTHLSAVEVLMMTSVRGLQTDTILERRMDGVSMAGRLSETVTFVERLQKR